MQFFFTEDEKKEKAVCWKLSLFIYLFIFYFFA